jgi:hypothetical protein
MQGDRVEELVTSLLYEGYALYPYTPSAIKNSTPTPFGIVYPPAYAERSSVTFDHVRLECALAEPAAVTASVRFLQAGGAERRIELAADDEPTPFDFDGLTGRARLRTEPLPDGRLRVRCCVHNTTAMLGAADAERSEALRHSLLSTHVLVRAAGGRFLSPLDDGLDSVNTYPVLASDADDAVLGAAIILPDHPQIAPESKGSLFDNTEIEEALLLHVHVLSDGERAEIKMSDDPALREMLARAEAATPQDFMDLHGRLEMKEQPVELRAGYEPSGFRPNGEEAVEIDGVRHSVGSKVRLQPGRGGDTLDSLIVGRMATIGKIFVDYDGRTYLGVTVDDDPAAELFGDTGRFLFFGPDEVEVVGS